MADTADLNMLRDLAQRRLNEAAVRLRAATGDLQQARLQLEQLHSYRHDYHMRARLGLDEGVSASNYRNFVRFLGTLEQAISLQNKAVGQMDEAVSQARTNWRHEKRRLDAYEALQARRAQASQQHENRREQHQTDEHAARRPSAHKERESLTAAP